MDQQRREALISALQAKGVRLPCPRCGGLNFDVVAESAIWVQEAGGAMVAERLGIPVAIAACRTCGYITEHALGPLGVPAGVAND